MLRKPYPALFGISFTILFLELILIRLIGTEIRIFAYLSNSILLASFVGVGLGMLIKKSVPIYYSALTLLCLIIILSTEYIVRLPNLEFKLFSGITELLAPLSESYIWLQTESYSKSGIFLGIFLTIFILGLVSFAFVPLGQYLGNLFNQGKRPVMMYSVNVFASLLGMWSFQVLSVVGISPYFGLTLVFGFVLLLSSDKYSRLTTLVAFIAAVVILMPKEAFQPYENKVTFWSPYQKLSLSLIKQQELYHPKGWYLEVNNVGYMGLLDLSSKAFEERRSMIEEHFRDKIESLKYADQYALPYLIKPDAKTALIIGGGAGNDAAAALRANLQNIDIVEIDPMVAAIGKKYHPELPYSDSRVELTINDGRAYLERTKNKYDIVIMSLADSHTTSSSLSNVQLDNYLYTQEALTKVKERLNDNGVFFLTFEVTRPWIGGRIQNTMTQVFGYKPEIVDIRSDGTFGWGGVMFIAQKNPSLRSANLPQDFSKFLVLNSKDYRLETSKILTDDWPYIYLDKPRIPLLHALVAIISLLGLFALRTKIIPKNKFNMTFLFLGAGFMLFEVQNISKSALLFGNNWMTNLFVISGVLLFILAANFSVSKKLIPLKVAFYILFLLFFLQIVIPLNFFNNFGFALKVVGGILFLTVPHFFSGVVFAGLFLKDNDRAGLFGSNLLGSAIGGFVAICSYLFGLSSLLFATILFYFFGFVLALRKYKDF